MEVEILLISISRNKFCFTGGIVEGEQLSALVGIVYILSLQFCSCRHASWIDQSQVCFPRFFVGSAANFFDFPDNSGLWPALYVSNSSCIYTNSSAIKVGNGQPWYTIRPQLVLVLTATCLQDALDSVLPSMAWCVLVIFWFYIDLKSVSSGRTVMTLAMSEPYQIRPILGHPRQLLRRQTETLPRIMFWWVII